MRTISCEMTVGTAMAARALGTGIFSKSQVFFSSAFASSICAFFKFEPVSPAVFVLNVFPLSFIFFGFLTVVFFSGYHYCTTVTRGRSFCFCPLVTAPVIAKK